MDNSMLVSPSSFCWNPHCSDYGKVTGNIRKFGRTPSGIQRYQCKVCHQTFVETIGTVFYNRHRSQETIIECLALLAERNSLAAIHRVKGVKEETVMEWLRVPGPLPMAAAAVAMTLVRLIALRRRWSAPIAVP